jgi:N6-L-threonylcarbamoyladenine synthase
MELLETPHLAWHLSGGTTELLYVKPQGCAVVCEIIGRTNDVSAGQIMDRTGKMLGLKFPAGKAVDKLSAQSEKADFYLPKFQNLEFSLSGVEHKMKQLCEAGETPENICRFVLLSVIATVNRVTERAKKIYGDIPVLFSGGVSSNSLLRQRADYGIFAAPEFSTDNAMGVAILTYRAVKQGIAGE